MTITTNQSSSLFWTIQKILKMMAQQAGFKNEKLKKLEEINQIVFSGDQNSWQRQFKFDISFPLNNKKIQRVRFSYNNKGERNWIKKIENIFKIFPKIPNKKLFDFIRGHKFESLTFGLDWPSKQREPKLKFYFEDKNGEIKKKIKKLPEIKKIFLEEFSLNIFLPLAIAIIFSSKGKIVYKIYFYFPKEKLLYFLKKNKLKMINKKVLIKKDCFFLLAISFLKPDKIISKKIYLIYEAGEFSKTIKKLNFDKRYSQLKKILTKSENKFLNHQKKLFEKEALNKFLIYPIGLSLNLMPNHNFGHKVIYLSLIPKYKNEKK